MFFSSFSFTEAEEDKSVCTTDSGAAPNLPCIFPFKFNGAVHTSCIWDMAHLTEHKAWCSTLVDDTGHHVGGQGKWGNCGPGCPIPPDNRNAAQRRLRDSFKSRCAKLWRSCSVLMI